VNSHRQVRARRKRLRWQRKRAAIVGRGPRSEVRICIPGPTEIATTSDVRGPQELPSSRDRDRTASDSAPVDPGTPRDGLSSNENLTECRMPDRGTASPHSRVGKVPCSPHSLRFACWTYGLHPFGACTNWSTFSLGRAAVCHLGPPKFHEL